MANLLLGRLKADLAATSPLQPGANVEVGTLSSLNTGLAMSVRLIPVVGIYWILTLLVGCTYARVEFEDALVAGKQPVELADYYLAPLTMPVEAIDYDRQTLANVWAAAFSIWGNVIQVVEKTDLPEGTIGFGIGIGNAATPTPMDLVSIVTYHELHTDSDNIIYLRLGKSKKGRVVVSNFMVHESDEARMVDLLAILEARSPGLRKFIDRMGGAESFLRI